MNGRMPQFLSGSMMYTIGSLLMYFIAFGQEFIKFTNGKEMLVLHGAVADVDYQRELHNSLIRATSQPAAVTVATPEITVESRTVSLKAISKRFWRHL